MIVLEQVKKEYGRTVAVNDISLRIETGEFFGLLGPNGAGKTTIIRMLSTLSVPSAGALFIDDIPVNRDNVTVKSKIGVVPQNMNLDIELTTAENLELHGRLHGMKRSDIKARTDELLAFTELTDRRDDPVKTFSGGMQRKLMIARALMHRPKVLLLDEPTVGLDASVRRRMWDMMKGLNRNGLTVILTTHYIEEAEMLCGRIGFIDRGQLIRLDTPENLIKENGNYVLEAFDATETQRYFFPNREDALLFAAGLTGEVHIREANLEDAFLNLTNRKVEE